jgi:hypothetical protein
VLTWTMRNCRIQTVREGFVDECVQSERKKRLGLSGG